MIKTAATPLIRALQINAFTGSREVKRARLRQGRRRYHNVEGRSARRPLGKANTPM